MLALRHGQTHPRLRREDRLLRGEQGLVVVDGIRVVEAVDGKVLGREAALVELGHEGVGGVVGPQGALLEIDFRQEVAPGRPHVVPPGGKGAVCGADLVVVLQGVTDGLGEGEGLLPGMGGGGRGDLHEDTEKDRQNFARRVSAPHCSSPFSRNLRLPL